MNEGFGKKEKVSFYKTGATFAVLLILAIVMIGCAKKEQTTVQAPPDIQMMENEPEFRIGKFVVLREATREIVLPYVSSGDGSREDTACFVPQEKLTPWQTTNVDILEMMAADRSLIHEIVSNWVVRTFEEFAAEPLSKGFKMKLKQPMIVHVPESKTRLIEEQTCIVESNGVFRLPAQVITTLFGSRVIEIVNQEPMSPETIKAMRKSAKEQGIRLQATPAEYPQALDESNNPLKDEKGRPLFLAPGGEHILRAQIPIPKKRPIFEWRLKFEDPLFFAAGDLPADSFEKEEIREQCDVYLVFDDATPRVPECGKPLNVGFGVTRSDTQSKIVVKVTADGQTTSKSIRFGKRTPILSAGRVLTWVTSKKVVEGARLFVDSVVLFPGSAVGSESLSPQPVQPSTASEPKKPKDSGKKPKKKKEPKVVQQEEEEEHEAPPPPIPVY